ncbi:hypothetical protein DPMN_016820 [Dreissena polymorpha]|uniref:Uncharacterized protein n=1 Tax=Dreissena polymorpha TaxID=45954 RepID=A0A9D4S6S1_DREPO|nr:hypothetical protein DPMN_016820 [Dreissena polymorpha]
MRRNTYVNGKGLSTSFIVDLGVLVPCNPAEGFLDPEGCIFMYVFLLTLQSRITHESASSYFQWGALFIAEETASRRDGIEIQGFRLRYPSSLRIDSLVLRAQCIEPIHARITWVSYQYISSWVGNT